MSARIASRQALRQSKWLIQRRAASSTTEAVSSGATKAKEATQEVASKAQSGLSRVTSSAGAIAGSTATALGNSLSGIGGRTGQLIGFVQSLIPPTMYYARVAGELGKIIVQGRGMQPPTAQTIQSYMQPLQKGLQNPSSLLSTANRAASSAADTAVSAASNPQSYFTKLRNMDAQTLTTTGIVAAEALGFFTIGEMIGRFKIIGYHGDAHAH